MCKINKDNIGLILSDENYNNSKLQIYSIPSNKIILEKNFDFYIENIKNINNNTFGMIKEDSLEIYSLIINTETKSLDIQMNTNIKIPGLNDFIYLSNKNHLMTIDDHTINVYDKNYNIIKKENASYISNCYGTEDGNIIFGTTLIQILNTNDWSYSILFSDNIAGEERSYLAGISTSTNYSNFNLTYFNKFICKQKFKQMVSYHYESLDDEVIADENNVMIFDYNPENDKMKQIEIIKNLEPKNICINEDDEMIVVTKSGINVYDLK